jgi:hypothetical protein
MIIARVKAFGSLLSLLHRNGEPFCEDSKFIISPLNTRAKSLSEKKKTKKERRRHHLE